MQRRRPAVDELYLSREAHYRSVQKDPNDVVERLVHPIRDERPKLTKTEPHTTRAPDFNLLYDSHRVVDGFKHTIDITCSGSFTTIANTSVLTPLAPLITYRNRLRLGEWPDSGNAYLVVRGFSCAPQSATFTNAGTVALSYISPSGEIAQLAVVTSSTSNFWQDMVLLLNTAIVDPGVNLGALSATLAPAGASTSVYDFQLNFGYAYLYVTPTGYKRRDDIADDSSEPN